MFTICSLGKLHIFKILILYKLISTFNGILIEISADIFLVDIDRVFLKFI